MLSPYEITVGRALLDAATTRQLADNGTGSRRADAETIAWLTSNAQSLLSMAAALTEVVDALSSSAAQPVSAWRAAAVVRALVAGQQPEVPTLMPMPSPEAWDALTTAFAENELTGGWMNCQGAAAVAAACDEIGMTNSAADWRDSHNSDCDRCN